MQVGYKLFAEGYPPKEIIRQAVAAERAGFDFVEMSDHYHPWLDSQGHSSFTWTVLGAVAARTERIGIATGVTCPTIRYHPAIIAQAAATLAIVSDGRFVLGIGAGERLNEHVVGREFPSVRIRHEMLREALEIIRRLWSGGYQSYDGKHLSLDDARVFDLPEEPPPIAVACSGSESVQIAADLGDGMFATDLKPSLVDAYRRAGGTGPAYVEVPVSWAPDADAAARSAWELCRFSVPGWKVMSELPNPTNFRAASETITVDDMRSRFAVGPDPDVHIEAVQRFVDAGFDRLAMLNAGPDQMGFIEFYGSELADRMHSIEPRVATGARA